MVSDYLENNYNIIIIESETYIQDTLNSIITLEKYNLTKYDNLDISLSIFNKMKYDILIIDSSVLQKKHLETIRKIRSINQDLYIIVLIDKKSEITIKDLQSIPVQGYCERNDKLEQLQLFVKTGIKYLEQLKTITDINNELLNSKKQIESAYLESIETLRFTVEAKDTYTRGHSDRVAAYSVLIGQKLGLSQNEIRTLRIGGMFHDIGKVGIPDSILLKSGKLTKEEYEEIKKHPVIGKNILSNAAIFKDIIPIVLYHHERYDGKGYPYGLSDKDIPFLARIVAVADAFDAMTTQRSYRPKMELKHVIQEIKSKIGTQFDPIAATTFLDVINNDFHLIQEIQHSY